MIDLSKIRFEVMGNSGSGGREILVVGVVKCLGAVRITSFDKAAIERAKREVRRCINHETYGELTDPIKELQYFALRCVAPADLERVKTICDRLDTLLNQP